MSKSIEKRHRRFALQTRASAALAEEYSEKVYSVWQDISATLSRDALLVVLLMAVFELLAYQRCLPQSTSIGSSDARKRAEVVQTALPAMCRVR